jgi:hypothetical protein
MRVPSKFHNIQLVQIQPEERLATTSELNFASSLVTGCGEASGMGYGVATQVKGLNHEIFNVSEADVILLTEGRTCITDSPNETWLGDASLARSETVAGYQMDIMVTRAGQNVLLTGVCAIKPIDGKILQTTIWELRSFLIKLFKSLRGQLIVSLKRGNARGGKGLAVEPFGLRHIHRTKRWIKEGNKAGLITYPVNGREVLLKSPIRENLKPCSVMGLIAASRRRWL